MSLIYQSGAKLALRNCKSTRQNAYYGRLCHQLNFLMSLSLRPLPIPHFSQLGQSYELGTQDLHIHCVDIRQFTAAHYADTAQIMSPDECERAQKFVRGKESYIASRWLLRKVLARYMGVTPGAVAFLRTDKGKPYLPQSNIHFSLSHSGHWALLAVGKAELIGVDIEVVAATRDLVGIAENYYHPHEFARMQLLPDEAQTDYFYRLWTLKEAILKAIGTGISAGLDKIELKLEGSKISAQIDAELGGNTDEWHFHQWALTAQDYCSLASKSKHSFTVKWFDALSAPAFP